MTTTSASHASLMASGTTRGVRMQAMCVLAVTAGAWGMVTGQGRSHLSVAGHTVRACRHGASALAKVGYPASVSSGQASAAAPRSAV